jgi:hypothetical protein
MHCLRCSCIQASCMHACRFHGAAFEGIKRDNVADLLAYAFFYKTRWAANTQGRTCA